MHEGKDQQVYKLTVKSGGRHHSIAAWPGLLGVSYVPHVATVPKVGYLFAFDSLDHAVAFTARVLSRQQIKDDILVVWHATATVVDLHPSSCLFSPRGAEQLKIFWREYKMSRSSGVPIDTFLWSTYYGGALMDTPVGTVLCSKITITEPVNKDLVLREYDMVFPYL